jgi:hypothetical protein
MKKIFWIGTSILALAVLALSLKSSGALYSETVSSTGNRFTAADLNLSFNGNPSDNLVMDLGEVKPGDSGTANITVSNIGTISGTLCAKLESFTTGFTIQTTDLCSVLIEPQGSVQFNINWSLPDSVHNTGLDGTKFQFSYSFLFENGYKITKFVILEGKINDPVETPTLVETDTPTETPIPTESPTDIPTDTPTAEPTP